MIRGSCLCGKVTFECKDLFHTFHLCHCTQCQKTTGSSYAANLFTSIENINWLSGAELVRRFDVEGRSISKAFCSECGCGLPYVSITGTALVVPAGCLDNKPDIQPQKNIFWSEKVEWYEAAQNAECVARF
jgi:hypothetical protein